MSFLQASKITPCLWFNNNAGDAVRFYTSVFKNSKIIQVNPFVSTFELEGLKIMVINGGPEYSLNEAFSFFVSCADQQEVDYYWQALLADGGKENRCGWLKDKFGVSWQIVPVILDELMSNPDTEKVQRVTQAMLKMIKLDIEGLKQAYNGA